MDAFEEAREAGSRWVRIAGLALLFSKALVIVANYGASFRLIVPDDAVTTARNLQANEALFRANIACNLLYAATVVVLLAALHRIFSRIDRRIALMVSACWMLVAAMWATTALGMLGALRLLGDTAYLSVFEASQLQAMARLQLSTSYDGYYVGLPFWGLAWLLGSCLLYRSRDIPRALAGAGIAASAWCVFCAFGFVGVPNFDRIIGAWAFDTPIFLFEVVLGFWLLFKGLAPAVPGGLREASPGG